MARHPLAQTGPSGRMCGGCRGLQDAAYGPASLAFSSFSRCWPTSGSINS
jgi:hypothetical protein